MKQQFLFVSGLFALTISIAWSAKIPSLQGQDWVPKEGDQVVFYLTEGEGKTYEPLLPNGMELIREPVDPNTLDRKRAEKVEVGFGMLGARNTLIFYTFAEQRVILMLTIGNEDESFPVSGKVYRFGADAPEESLKKWINNRHSDALFVDAAKPVSTTELPEGVCTVSKFKKGEVQKSGPESSSHQEYEVTIQLKEHALGKELKLASFTDQATVRVKLK